ncbi:MAG: hypothetical protein LBP87_01270 [Planctomycetaceae bacterium]|nr:hypothetical protein [Planctomycetaceae bacterium]
MHNRRCSAAEPTDRQHPTQFFKPCKGEIINRNNHNLAPCGALFGVVDTCLSVGCASLNLRLCTSRPCGT